MTAATEPEGRGGGRRAESLLFEEVVLHHSDGIVIVDDAGVVRFANRAAEHLLGDPTRPLVGERFEHPLPDDDPVVVPLDLDGPPRVVELRTSPTSWRGHHAALVTARDVTARFQAEQRATLLTHLVEDVAKAPDVSSALASALQRLSTHTGWAVTEAWMPVEGGEELELVASWSDDCEELLAFREASRRHRLDPRTAAEVRPFATGEPAWMLDGLEQADSPRGLLAAQAGLTCAVAVPLETGSGSIGVLVFLGRKPRDADQRLFALVPTVALQLGAAISRRRAEAQLARTARELELRNDELEQSNADLSEFASIASHDLRQPLAIVAGYLQTLQRLFGDRLPAEGLELVEGAESATRRMNELVADLLAYARAGTMPLERREVATADLVGRVVGILSPDVERSAATVEVADLPAVHADPVQLEQVFQNLIGNALKYVQGTVPHVRVEGETIADLWCFRVIDNGVGIPEGDRERIFDMFTRLEAQRFPGTGIGLAVCRRVVERHGGRLWVEARPEGGSVFWFTLPREPGLSG